MDRFIYIRNGEDDAYVNTADNFKGMVQAGSGAVQMFFDAAAGAAGNNGGFDKIILGVTANKEKEAMNAIGGALAGAKAGSTAVIADDHGAKYCSDEVTSVTSITLNTTSNAINTVEAVALSSGTKTLTTGDSGKTFMLTSGGAYAIALPVAADLIAGENYKFVVKAVLGSGAITIQAGSAIIDSVHLDAGGDAATSTAGTAVSNIILGTSANQGDTVNIFTDGTTYYAECFSGVNGAITTS